MMCFKSLLTGKNNIKADVIARVGRPVVTQLLQLLIRFCFTSASIFTILQDKLALLYLWPYADVIAYLQNLLKK